MGMLTVTPLLMIFLTQYKENRMRFDSERYHSEMEMYKRELEQRQLQFRKEMTEMSYRISRMSADSINISDTQLRNELRFSKIESNIEKHTEITTALRQAINPLNPDEVLTIARLKDGLSDLGKKIAELENNINVRQQYFEDSIKREMASSNNSTTLILVVLIPLVFNFLYTVWKDFRKPAKNETQQMPNANN